MFIHLRIVLSLKLRNMKHDGPIIIIEDDHDDQDMMIEVFKGLPYTNEILFFDDGISVLDYLNKEGKNCTPFMIISDINLPILNGFALREKIKTDEELQLRCVPYIFLSTYMNSETVRYAYRLSVQGFFLKPNTFRKLQETINSIINYWMLCAAPNYIK